MRPASKGCFELEVSAILYQAVLMPYLEEHPRFSWPG
jgi:hypothetical protein